MTSDEIMLGGSHKSTYLEVRNLGFRKSGDTEYSGGDEGDSVDEKLDEKTEIMTPEKAKASAGNRKLTFQIRDVSLGVPRGALWAITGPVGCGKSSLLQGLVGGMCGFSSPRENTLARAC